MLGNGRENTNTGLPCFPEGVPSVLEETEIKNKNHQGTEWLGWVFKNKLKFKRQRKPAVRVGRGQGDNMRQREKYRGQTSRFIL